MTVGGRLRDALGFSLVELLIATAIVGVIFAAAAAAIHRTAEAAGAVPEAADRAQTLRVAVDALARDIRSAGASVHLPLAVVVPVIVPARLGVDPDLAVSSDRVTVLYSDPNAGGPAWPYRCCRATRSRRSIPHRVQVPACGFHAGDRAVVVDDNASDGGYDLFTVEDASAAGLRRGNRRVCSRKTIRRPPSLKRSSSDRSFWIGRIHRTCD